MRVTITREQIITATINAWLESGVIRDIGDEVERAVLALNEYDTEDLLHIMLEAAQHRVGNAMMLSEYQPDFVFSMN